MKQLLAAQLMAAYLRFIVGESYDPFQMINYLVLDMLFLGLPMFILHVYLVWRGDEGYLFIKSLPYVFAANIVSVLFKYQYVPWWVLLISTGLTIILLMFVKKKFNGN